MWLKTFTFKRWFKKVDPKKIRKENASHPCAMNAKEKIQEFKEKMKTQLEPKLENAKKTFNEYYNLAVNYFNKNEENNQNSSQKSSDQHDPNQPIVENKEEEKSFFSGSFFSKFFSKESEEKQPSTTNNETKKEEPTKEEKKQDLFELFFKGDEKK